MKIKLNTRRAANIPENMREHACFPEEGDPTI
jgi:hypothetical protein